MFSETPSANTVQGELPSSLPTSSASPAPKSISPAMSRANRDGVGRQRLTGMGAGDVTGTAAV